MSVRFLGRTKALLAATALTATMAVGCTAGQWEPQAPPAAGVQQDQDGIKVRNLLIVTDEAGNAVLEGRITADRPFVLSDAAYAAEQSDGTWSDAAPLAIAGGQSEGNTLALGGTDNAFQAAELSPGHLARVGLRFEEGVQIDTWTFRATTRLLTSPPPGPKPQG
ncbi:MAG: hypothetical protein R2722_10540 [Tessaracoccus sp.]